MRTLFKNDLLTLKAKLREMGLGVSGRKPELRERPLQR